MKPGIKISIAVFIAASLLISYSYNYYRESAIARYVDDFQKMSYKVERGVIENIPVYRDYARPEISAELKKFDLAKHMEEAAKHGIPPMKNTDDISSAVKAGKLVQLQSGGDELYYFHNVRNEYRYLTPAARDGLRIVAERFQLKLKEHNDELPVVKLAISSVIRTVDYQEKIFGRKFVSVHSFGGCFDIFFDDYFVKLPEPEKHGGIYERLRKSLYGRTGFLMGDALREQFRSVLSETLLELQREGLLYVFLEDDNRCYHITILAGKR